MTPRSRPKSQESQYFDVDDVPDPAPLTSLSQMTGTDVVDLPRAIRANRGVPRMMIAAQRAAPRGKEDEQRKKYKEGQQTRVEEKLKKQLEPRNEGVSQIEDGMSQIIFSL